MANFHALAAVRNTAWRGNLHAGGFIRQLCLSGNRKGLEEFFPPGVLESDEPAMQDLENVKTGRRWHASDLRLKSNSDLHKLWYVLLKERNMLQTVKEEAKRLQIPMPSPERIKKVQKSMAMIKVVIGERERAIRTLESQGYEAQAAVEVKSIDKKDDNYVNRPEDKSPKETDLLTKSQSVESTSNINVHLEQTKLSAT